MAFPSLPRRLHGPSVWVLYAIGLAPAVWTFYLGATGGLGADPVKTFERFLGLWALRFLILTLAVTPARDIFGWNYLRYRRALGLLAFYYAAMHFSVYLILDQSMNVGNVVADVIRRPFITIGMLCLILLVPLALTSNNWSIKRLGSRWGKLHKLIYVIAAGAAFHYYLSMKITTVEQAVYIALVVIMLAYRLMRPGIMRKRRERLARDRQQSAVMSRS